MLRGVGAVASIVSAAGLRPTLTAARGLVAPRSLEAVDTLIFDIDDTLYATSCGFSEHRNGDVVGRFMVDVLGFDDVASALVLRDEVFREHHSTLKGLTVASHEGRLPRPFVQSALGDYWAAHCDFPKFLPKNEALVQQLRELSALGYRLVVFTNAPRAYGLKCLDSLGIREFFADDRIFGVEDVMPACKPEAAAFETVLRLVGSTAARSVMFEDSMKNVQACAALGMRTVLVDENRGRGAAGEAALLGDVADVNDEAVDYAVRRITEIKATIPELWQRTPPATPSE